VVISTNGWKDILLDRTPAEAPEWLLKLMEREEVLLTPFEGSSIIVEIKKETATVP